MSSTPELLEQDVSVGTNSLLHAITTLDVKMHVVLINLLTIARNASGVVEKDTFGYDNKLQQKTLLDLEKILLYLDRYCSHLEIERLPVLVYLNDTPIHPDYVRNVSESKAKQLRYIHSATRNILKAKLSSDRLMITKSIIPGAFNRAVVPWLSKSVRNYPKISALLISHQPVHYHLLNNVMDLKIIKSYTGEIVSGSTDIGKYVLKAELPFNKYTHLLFGDKETIKPLLKGNQKQLALNVAKKNNWIVQPLSNIKRDILNLGNISLSYLDNFKP